MDVDGMDGRMLHWVLTESSRLRQPRELLGQTLTSAPHFRVMGIANKYSKGTRECMRKYYGCQTHTYYTDLFQAHFGGSTNFRLPSSLARLHGKATRPALFYQASTGVTDCRVSAFCRAGFIGRAASTSPRSL